MSLPRTVLLLACSALAATTAELVVTDAPAPYQWENVVIGGGGYVTGVTPHPKVPGLLWLSSDVSGPWRREAGQTAWQAIGWNTYNPHNVSGVKSLAVDPSDPQTVYMERGDLHDPARRGLYVTRDGGKTWDLALSKFLVSNSGPERKWRSSIAVDPQQPKVVYWGTYRDGLQRSLDGGRTWRQVLAPPALGPDQPDSVLDPGIRCVAIDPTASSAGRSRVIYAGVGAAQPPKQPPANGKPAPRLVPDQVRGVYRSTDGGETFKQLTEFNALPQQPKIVKRLICGSDGTLFVNHEAGIARLDATGWKDITPKNALLRPGIGSGEGLAVNPRNPRDLVWLCVTKPKGEGKWFHQALFRSRDGGETWTWVNNDDGQIEVGERIPWAGPNFPVPAAGSDLEFDPHHDGRVWLADAYMVYQIDDVWAERPVLDALWQGFENTVGITLSAPPAASDGQAPELLSGVSDVRGFRHADVRQPPTRYISSSTSYDDLTYVTGYDYCEGNPAVLLCVKHRADMGTGKVLRSVDGGQRWQEVGDPLGRNFGGAKIAVSATWSGSVDTLKAVFAPGNGQTPRYTADGGKTWAPCLQPDGTPLPAFSGITSAYSFSRMVAADRVDGEAFYLYHGTSGSFWVSRDGGKTFAKKDFQKWNANPADSLNPPTIEAVPGRAGEVWAAISGHGIKRTRDYGETWETLAGIFATTSAKTDDPRRGRPALVTFGMAAPGKPANEPTVYVFAKLKGEPRHALLRSGDIAVAKLSDMRWERVQDWTFGGMSPNIIQASRQRYGRIFMTGDNHGVLMGNIPGQ